MNTKAPESVYDAKFMIDYAKTLEQAIAECKFNRVNELINSQNFPIIKEIIEKKVSISGKLLCFNREISTEDAISEMDKMGFRPATLMELLAFALVCPDLQEQFSIIALGSLWRSSDDFQFAPYLGFDNNNRYLNLPWFISDWKANSYFLGIYK